MKMNMTGMFSSNLLKFCICWTLFVAKFTLASYNLYLKAPEVKRLLGLNAELQYVKDGTVNDYALGFAMMVPSHISDLHFTWQRLKATPVSYSIRVTIDNPEVVSIPHLNISNRGIIPASEEVFKLSLYCTENINAEIQVLIHINVTVSPPARDVTRLVLKRKKICLKNDDVNGTLMLADAIITNSYSFYVGIGCASAAIILVAAVAVTTYFRSNKVRTTDEEYGDSSALSAITQHNAFIRVDSSNNGSMSGSSSYKRITPAPSEITVPSDDARGTSIPDQLSEITIARKHIILHEKLLEGTFGKIQHASIINDDGITHAFVKTVTDHASQIQVSLMMAEGMMMLGLNHKSILPLTGICSENPQHPLLIYPYMNRGNLKQFLVKCRFAMDGHTLVTQDLVAMAIQIVQGMQYLHKRKIVHRDIATRNCVIDDWYQVKITDTSLSRDLFPGDYHCLGDNENRPVKWLAMESLSRKEFTYFSDVWSFGVTLWEMMTLAQQPYSEIDPFEMDSYLMDGYRLAQPVNCPDELFSTMACCWMSLPDERPNTHHLLSNLQNFFSALNRFI